MNTRLLGALALCGALGVVLGLYCEDDTLFGLASTLGCALIGAAFQPTTARAPRR